MTRVNVFIDAEYVIQSLRRLKNKPKEVNISKDDINWAEFIKALVLEKHNADGTVTGTINYYTARMIESINKKNYDNQTAYLEKLKTVLKPFDVNIRLGTMSKTEIKQGETWDKDRHKNNTENKFTLIQKGIDTKIVWDLCDYYHTANPTDDNYAILVAGDGDFADALNKLKEKGITTQVIAFDRPHGLSKELKNSADTITVFNYKQLADNGFIMPANS